MAMIRKSATIQEGRAINFALKLMEYGFGYTIRIPSRQLSKELTEKGFTISFLTIISYWKALERMGYVTRQMGARINGVTYYLNRYAFKKLSNQSTTNDEPRDI